MYNTPLGIRVLQAAERAFFVESLGMMVDNLSVCDQFCGIAVFDDLQRNQKIAMLHMVARALLGGDQPPLTLTAVVEGTVASIYEHAREMLLGELADADADADWNADDEELFGGAVDLGLPTWRERVLDACREMEVGGDLPDASSQDRDAWDLLVACLEDCVLWDNDWELSTALDAEPTTSREAREELGIAEDYFTAIAPDPNDKEAERLLQELVELTADGRGLY